jgi:hypothetical protein
VSQREFANGNPSAGVNVGVGPVLDEPSSGYKHAVDGLAGFFFGRQRSEKALGHQCMTMRRPSTVQSAERPSDPMLEAMCVSGDQRVTLPFLNPEKALIFRITHRDNLPWILEHGLHAQSSKVLDPNFRQIGDPDLIGKRPKRAVPIGPGGTLSNYIPFYFTPCSIMFYNILTGYRGITQFPEEEIIVFVSSLHRVAEFGIPFVFTDRHAYTAMAKFSSDVTELGQVDWEILRGRDFKGDVDDLGKKERYHAEALIWEHMPVEALLGICSFTEDMQQQIQSQLDQRGLTVETMMRRDWYFKW